MESIGTPGKGRQGPASHARKRHVGEIAVWRATAGKLVFTTVQLPHPLGPSRDPWARLPKRPIKGMADTGAGCPTVGFRTQLSGVAVTFYINAHFEPQPVSLLITEPMRSRCYAVTPTVIARVLVSEPWDKGSFSRDKSHSN